MRYWILSLLLAYFSLSSAKATVNRDEEIRQLFADLTVALNNKDAEAVSQAFSQSGEVITLAGGIYKGPQEIKAFFQEGFQGPYKASSFEHYIQYIRWTDAQHAVVDGVWNITNSALPNYPSCGIFVYQFSRQNGVWKLDLSYSSVPRQGHTSEHGRTVSWTKICYGLLVEAQAKLKEKAN